MSGFTKFCFLVSFILIDLSVFGQYNFGHIKYSEGLSHNNVLCFTEDNNGYLWIGTNSGLNKYDGYTIKAFKSNSDSFSIPENRVNGMVKDQLGRIWIGQSDGYCLFNPEKESFTRHKTFVVNNEPFQLSNINLVKPYGDSVLFLRIYGVGIIQHNLYNNENKLIVPLEGDTTSISSSVSSYYKVHKHLLYIIYESGLIELFDIKSQKVIKRIRWIEEYTGKEPHSYELYIDEKNTIWVFSKDIAIGVFRITGEGRLVKHLSTESEPALNSNLVTGILDIGNNTWIGTDHGGINIYNQADNSIHYVTNKPLDKNSLSQNVITSLYMSQDSTIWIGTFKQGVNYYHPKMLRFKHFGNNPVDKNSLPYNDVNCFAEDQLGNIWIGTNGEGLIYFDRENNSYSQFKSKNSGSEGLKSDVIVSLCIDHENVLWIGTYHGGLSRYDGERFTNYSHDQENPRSINDNKVWDIFEDSKGNLWIGLLGGGLDVFDREKQQFYHFLGSGVNSVNSSFVMDITEDRDGIVWFGTEYGIYSFNPSNSRFLHFEYKDNDIGSLSDDFIYKVFVDSNNNLWVGTRNGLNLLNRTSNSFKRFYSDDGLADNSILSILESNKGDLFLSTPNGITKLIIDYDEKGGYQSHFTENFIESDGLQGREFNEGSALKTKKGELIFGGANGFNLFIPEDIDINRNSYLTHIVGIQIYGDNFDKIEKIQGNESLQKTILDGVAIKMPYDIRMFSLDFVAIDFQRAKKIKYRYKLEGFNKQWIYTDWQDRKATFTNLSPGRYEFVVQASDYLSDWSTSESSISLRVLPPWYRTLAAFISYVVVVVLLVLFLRYIILSRERNKFQQEQAIKESERQQELNHLKTRFFTNVSHEFRTPLSLIITPLERVLQGNVNEQSRQHLELIYRNANRLLNLVNQLLDFRRAEENKLKLNLIYGNIVNLIDQTISSFQDMTESKHIDLRHLPYSPQLFMQFDKDKVEKILINLLSNAFKFTQVDGHINVVSRLIKRNKKEIFRISVEDNGIGIEKEMLDQIFERFYQTDLPSNFITRGSGIGLSLTKDFVELHKGRVYVKSEPGQGSQFTVELPVDRTPAGATLEENIEKETIVPKFSKTIDEEDSVGEFSKTILLIEDNEDFRSYLKNSLKTKYNILEAENGRTGLDVLEASKTDLIVSDIMMPELDGLQLCTEVKTNPNYSHIPVILLTAKSTQDDKLDGLKHGADEYITKPFSFDILDARITYLLKLRENFIQQYQRTFKIEAETKSITSLDEKLLTKALEFVKENITNPELSVEFMSKKLGMSRVNLYKKMTSLTGKTPVEFIRLVRLKKAAELILQDQYNISEIAYDVGYNDPKYFSKQFKAEFGMLPSKFKDEHGKV